MEEKQGNSRAWCVEKSIGAGVSGGRRLGARALAAGVCCLPGVPGSGGGGWVSRAPIAPLPLACRLGALLGSAWALGLREVLW